MRDAWSLARLNLVRRPMAFALLAALVALAAAAYLGTGAFAAEVLVAIEPRLELGLGGLVLARLECWAYSQTRYVNDPTRVDDPRDALPETRYRCLVSDEAGGELEALRGHGDVAGAWVARLTTLELPWGTGELLSLQPGAPLIEDLEFRSGGLPSSPAEVAVPAEVAELCGLWPGDEVPYLATDTLRSEASSGRLAVSGVFVGGRSFLRGAIGWLPPTFGAGYLIDLEAHYVRELGNFEPNAYLIELRAGSSASGFLEWLVDPDFVDAEGYYHIHPRYPVRSTWAEGVAREMAQASAFRGVSPLTGLVAAVLSFVGLAAFTTHFLSFLGRRREMAVLKTVGFSGAQIGLVHLMELGLVFCCGLGFGLGGGAALLRSLLGLRVPAGLAVGATVGTGAVLAASAALPAAMVRQATVAELLGAPRAIAIRRHLVLADQGPLGVAFRPPRGIGGGHGEAGTVRRPRG